MLKSLAEQDAMKAAKKAEQAAKKRKKWNFEFRPFSLNVQVLLVNSKVVVSKWVSSLKNQDWVQILSIYY